MWPARRRVAPVLVLLAAASCPQASADTAPVETQDVRAADALSWGLDAALLKRVRSAGLKPWLREQLHPAPPEPLPPAVEARLAALAPDETPVAFMATLSQHLKDAASASDPAQSQAAKDAYNRDLIQAMRAAGERTLLRAIHSPYQLRERMTWFWFNHFNVYVWKSDVRAMIGDYVDTALRPHALGRFSDLLRATLRHPAMLRYLDNANNRKGRSNENYARELLELHTLGVDGRYTQEDVEQLARILTGTSIYALPDDPKLPEALRGDLVRDGLFIFNPAWHDYGPKTLLGHPITRRGYGEIEQAIEILCRSPATARHISRQIAEYFLGVEPPGALIDGMSGVFLRSGGDIAAVLDAMADSPAFLASVGAQYKDPTHYVLSALRLAQGDAPVLNAAPALAWLSLLGRGLFLRTTPDGYPLDASSWTVAAQFTTRFDIARRIGVGLPLLTQTDATAPPSRRDGAPALQDDPYVAYLTSSFGDNTRQALAKAKSTEEWNTMLLSSPEFMR